MSVCLYVSVSVCPDVGSTSRQIQDSRSLAESDAFGATSSTFSARPRDVQNAPFDSHGHIRQPGPDYGTYKTVRATYKTVRARRLAESDAFGAASSTFSARPQYGTYKTVRARYKTVRAKHMTSSTFSARPRDVQKTVRATYKTVMDI